MKYRGNPESKKGMLFIGDSFTRGQGLWWYSFSPVLETYKEQEQGYSPWLYTTANLKFKNRHRFPRLVADHFDSFEIVHPSNGGANDLMVEYWTESLNDDNNHGSFIRNTLYDHLAPDIAGKTDVQIAQDYPTWFDQLTKTKHQEISHVVFQLTYWPRSRITNFDFIYRVGRPLRLFDVWNPSQHYKDLFSEWLLNKNMDLFQFHNEFIANDFNNVKTFLQGLEEKGIKTYIMTWSPHYVPLIKQDELLADKLITFEYNNSTYECIEDMFQKNPGLEILGDYEHFETPPVDSHPSLHCHRLFADSIIKKIEKDKNG